MKGLCRVLTALKKCEYFSSFLFLPSPCLFILTPKVHLFEKTNTAIPTCPWASNYAHISFLHPPLQSVSLKVSLEMKADSAHDSRALKIKAGKKKKERKSKPGSLSLLRECKAPHPVSAGRFLPKPCPLLHLSCGHCWAGGPSRSNQRSWEGVYNKPTQESNLWPGSY